MEKCRFGDGSLSVIMPVYNEAHWIDVSLKRVHEALSGIDYELIVVDDASDDGTREILEKRDGKDGSTHEFHGREKIYYHTVNSGKGAALRTAIRHAAKAVVVIQDADFEYDPAEIPSLVKPILDGYADVVYGSRFSGGEVHRVVYFWHRVGNAILTLMSNMFTNLNLSDMETCYKAFKREIIQDISLQENRFGFEPEITAKIARRNLRIYEIGISYRGRTYDEGKKINWRDGFRAIYCIIKYGIFAK